MQHRESAALRWHDCRRWFEQGIQCPYQFLDDENDPDFDNDDPEFTPPVSRPIPVLPKVPPKSKKAAKGEHHSQRHRRGRKTGGKNPHKLYHGPPDIPKSVQEELDDIFKKRPVPRVPVPPVPPPIPPVPIPVPVGYKKVPTWEPNEKERIVDDALGGAQREVYPRWLTKGRLKDFPAGLEAVVSRSGSSDSTPFDAEEKPSNSQLPPRSQESISRAGIRAASLAQAETRLAGSLAGQRGLPVTAPTGDTATAAPRRNTSRDVTSWRPGAIGALAAAAIAGGTSLIASGIRRQSTGGGSRATQTYRGVGRSGGGGIGHVQRSVLSPKDFGRFAF